MPMIRNPGEWSRDWLIGASRSFGAFGRALRGSEAEAARPVTIRRLGASDLTDALSKGFGDVMAGRADLLMLAFVYPLAGLAAVALAANRALLPMLFPALAGFALVGPAAAIGFYEISRRRERGEPARWVDALMVIASPKFGAILTLSLATAAAFLLWMATARVIWSATLGPEPPASVGALLVGALFTPEGWALIGLGLGAGFLFAAAILATSVLSFPMLLDRDVGVIRAVATSVAVTRANPRVIAAWGVIVAVSLALAIAPAFLGLIFVLPMLGHATWRLYRRAVG